MFIIENNSIEHSIGKDLEIVKVYPFVVKPVKMIDAFDQYYFRCFKTLNEAKAYKKGLETQILVETRREENNDF